MRSFDDVNARPLANIGGAYAPFFSPDSRWIGFFESTEIKKVSITGGPVITLGPVTGRPLGASWGDDNTIVFATDDTSTGLWSVSADGGEPKVLTTPDTAKGESDHQFPAVLPDRRGVLFTIAGPGNADNARVAVLDLKTGKWKTLVRGGSGAEYVDHSSGAGQGGYLLYATAGTLRAVRFDPVRMEVQSDPVTVVDQLMIKPSGAANYAVSRSTLVYVPPEAGEQIPMRSLVWVDRNGREEPVKGAPTRRYGPPRVSPDGKRMAIGILDQDRTNVWIWDFALETLRPLTSASGMNGLPVWTLDSQRIIFMSDRTGVLNLYSQAADFTGAVVQITTSASSHWPTSITRDGEWIVAFERWPRTTSSEIVAFPLTSPATRPQSGRAGGLTQSLAESIAAIRLNGSWADCLSERSISGVPVERIWAGGDLRASVSGGGVASAGRSRREEGHAPCGHGMASSCSTSTNQVRSLACLSGPLVRGSSRARLRGFSTLRMPSPIPRATTTSLLMAGAS